MSDTIVVKTKTCTVCGEYEVWSLDRKAVESWQGGEYIQNAFPDMSAEDRELLISGTHPACWDKLFPKEDEGEQCTRCESMVEANSLVTLGDWKLCEVCEGDI
jgi:hypothetical protein